MGVNLTAPQPPSSRLVRLKLWIACGRTCEIERKIRILVSVFPSTIFSHPLRSVAHGTRCLFLYCSCVSTKVIRDLKDACRHGAKLRITCGACDKQSIINPMVVLDKLPANTTIRELGRRMRCSSSGRKMAIAEIAG